MEQEITFLSSLLQFLGMYGDRMMSALVVSPHMAKQRLGTSFLWQQSKKVNLSHLEYSLLLISSYSWGPGKGGGLSRVAVYQGTFKLKSVHGSGLWMADYRG